MQRFCLVFLALVIALSLFGCGQQGPVSVTDRYGKEYTLDREQQTLSDGTHTYEYTFSGDSENFDVSIKYPNGASYQYHGSNGLGNMSWSKNYDETTYARGDVLAELLADYAPKRGIGGRILGALALIGLGIFQLACPEAAWHLSYGWRYRNAEPSDAALVFGRIAGGIVVIVGIFMLLC